MTNAAAVSGSRLERLLAEGTTTSVGDFGGLSTGQARGVVTPQLAQEFADWVEDARRLGVGLTPRGLGRSQSGQAVPRDSVVLNLDGLKRVEPVDRAQQLVRCEAGATFAGVLAHTLPLGLAPPVCPLNLDLSIGGVLSAGGLGSTSHRAGFAASHVERATVVLGTGELVETGPQLERDVYDCVFGGVGRAGIITSVDLKLEQVALTMTTYSLLYRDLAPMLADQETLAGDGRVLHLDGLCSASVLGLRTGASGRREPIRAWSHALHFSVAEGEGASLLEKLHHDQVVNTQRDEVAEFARRFEIRFQSMRATGAWDQLHPWFEVLVPMAEAQHILGMAKELPPFFGDAIRVAPVRCAERPRSISLPAGDLCVAVAVLPVGIPETLKEYAMRSLAELDAAARSVGGKRYLSGWLFATDPDGWHRHYEDTYPWLQSQQARFNPEHTLRSSLPF